MRWPGITPPKRGLRMSVTINRMVLGVNVYLSPRQLRGPREKGTSHLSSFLPSSPSQRSGLNTSGSSKRVAFRCTMWLLISTTVCRPSLSIGQCQKQPGETYTSRYKLSGQHRTGHRDHSGQWGCDPGTHSQCFFDHGRLDLLNERC